MKFDFYLEQVLVLDIWLCTVDLQGDSTTHSETTLSPDTVQRRLTMARVAQPIHQTWSEPVAV